MPRRTDGKISKQTEGGQQQWVSSMRVFKEQGNDSPLGRVGQALEELPSACAPIH